MSHLRDVDRADCLERIGRGVVGRVALSTAGGPLEHVRGRLCGAPLVAAPRPGSQDQR